MTFQRNQSHPGISTGHLEKIFFRFAIQSSLDRSCLGLLGMCLLLSSLYPIIEQPRVGYGISWTHFLVATDWTRRGRRRNIVPTQRKRAYMLSMFDFSRTWQDFIHAHVTVLLPPDDFRRTLINFRDKLWSTHTYRPDRPTMPRWTFICVLRSVVCHVFILNEIY